MAVGSTCSLIAPPDPVASRIRPMAVGRSHSGSKRVFESHGICIVWNHVGKACPSATLHNACHLSIRELGKTSIRAQVLLAPRRSKSLWFCEAKSPLLSVMRVGHWIRSPLTRRNRWVVGAESPTVFKTQRTAWRSHRRIEIKENRASRRNCHDLWISEASTPRCSVRRMVRASHYSSLHDEQRSKFAPMPLLDLGRTATNVRQMGWPRI